MINEEKRMQVVKSYQTSSWKFSNQIFVELIQPGCSFWAHGIGLFNFEWPFYTGFTVYIIAPYDKKHALV